MNKTPANETLEKLAEEVAIWIYGRFNIHEDGRFVCKVEEKILTTLTQATAEKEKENQALLIRAQDAETKVQIIGHTCDLLDGEVVGLNKKTAEQAKEIESVKALALDQARNAGKFSALYDQRGDQLTAANNRIKELEKALRSISCRAPIMGSKGDYREGQLHALEACREVAQQALTSTANEKREE